ncbi:MAG: right-handed parallel beta-helix repeat-containing protein, partial [Candidatus Thermoplasmatota archaeon]|nr:right-handed parallel beta-helix repeat-containing protein [Candidatus Thermoplasmatota archaeon]
AGIKVNTNGNRIENCTIVECWDGIELNHGQYNDILACCISHNEKEGIYFLYAHHNVISYADIPYNQESIFLDSSDYNRFTAITAQHNKEEGIQLRDSSYNTFSSCHVSLNPFGYGFYIQCNSDNNILSACDIAKNGVGVFFTSSDTEGPCGTVISFSNIAENSGTGIFFMGNGSRMNDTHIHYNNICNNKKGIMAANAHDCFIYAQNNWWGRKLGPRFIGLQKSNRIAWKFTDSRVFFHPWLTNPV